MVAVGSEETTCLLNQQETEGAREKEKHNENIRTGGEKGKGDQAGVRASMRKREGCGEEAGRRGSDYLSAESVFPTDL